MSAIIPLATAGIALFFGLTVLDQYGRRRRPFTLVWALGLLLYGLGTLMQGLHEAAGPQSAVFRLWYWSGAMLVPAYLGTGTVYLLAPRPIAHAVMAILGILTVVALALVLAVGLEKPLGELEGQVLTSRGFFPGYIVALTIILNTYGTIALVGGAVWSAYVFARKRTMPHRVVSNVLIAVGALVSAAGGALGRVGVPQPHAVALLIGVLIIYAGFLRSRETFDVPLPFLRRWRQASEGR